MEITKIEVLSTEETIRRLKKTPLRGPLPGLPGVVEGEKIEVFKYATLMLEPNVDTNLIVPPQRYVLKEGVERTIELAKIFEKKNIDIFALTGAVLFWIDGMSHEDQPIPLLPPFVEQSIEETGGIWLLNDGMHRVYTARKLGRPINIILAINVPPQFPYYAYPIEEGWVGVTEIDELTDGYQKKEYRNPGNYKALFRQFNVVFPGIQESRAKVSPEEVKK